MVNFLLATVTKPGALRWTRCSREIFVVSLTLASGRFDQGAQTGVDAHHVGLGEPVTGARG